MYANSTCWLMIRGAAEGRKEDRDTFGLRYEPVIRAYLGARWRGTPRIEELDDAVQEVFVECFREGGVLDRVDSGRPGGFRAFLYGVARNVSFRFERRAGVRREREAAAPLEPKVPPCDEEALAREFDRAWTKEILRQAAQLQTERAGRADETALRRVEILRLRFQEDMPIRDIARQWQVDAAVLHKEYAKARQEFKEALLDVVAFHHPGSPGEVERECAEMLGLLA